MSEKSNVDTLEAEILQHAEEQAEKTVERSKKIADRVIRQAERHKKEILEKFRAKAEQEATVYAKKMESAMRLDIKRILSQKENDIIQKVLAEAEKAMISSLRNDPARYKTIMTKLVTEAIEILDGDTFQITVAKEDEAMATSEIASIASKISASLKREVKIAVRPSEATKVISGGAIIYSSDGKNDYDNSFEGRRKRIEDDLRWEIYRKLIAE